MIELNIEKILRTHKGTQSLKVAMQIEEGDLVAVYGPSGVGKTTLLRIIAGLTTTGHASIIVNASVWLDTNKRINWKAQERKVGFVFQDYALFPNMTIFENLKFANPNLELIAELLAETELEALKDRKPHQLSGGQQQRVALARALVMQPALLLLDEPLSALDNDLRRAMQDLIARLHAKYKMTTIMVSHDVPEILHLANRLLVVQSEKATVWEQPLDYFKRQPMHQHLELKATIILIVESVAHLKIGTQVFQLMLSKQQVKEFKQGDSILMNTFAMQPILKKIAE